VFFAVTANIKESDRMAEMTITLRIDPVTNKKDIVVTLRSDEDALPHEHEQLHRQLVDRLTEGGLLKAGEAGKLVIEREEESDISQTPVGSPSETERRSATEGQ
jgi:hypothetical protein